MFTQRQRGFRTLLALSTFVPLTFSAVTSLAPFQASASTAPKTFYVTRYGADPTGTVDSTVAIRNAITAAESTSGPNIVYFPSGTYILNRNDGAAYDFVLNGPNPIIVEGAGRDLTKVVEEVGLQRYPLLTRTKGIFEIVKGGNGSTITGLTADAQTYTAGTVLEDFGNNTTIRGDRFLGADSSSSYNSNVFDARVNAVCDKTNNVFNYGNVVDDLILNGRGRAGNVDLDISCQHNTQVSNVIDTGDGMALYIDHQVSVTNYTFTPGTVQASPKSYMITAPSSYISLSNITTYGNGGILEQSPSYRIGSTTISNERMLAVGSDYQLVIGDADNTIISGSSLLGIRIAPDIAVNGVTVSSSVVSTVTCAPATGATITGLSGIKC